MQASRRSILKAAALGLGGSSVLGLTGCEQTTSALTGAFGQSAPDKLDPSAAASDTISADFHLLSRAAYGPWPGDLAKLAKQGRDAWIEEQLHPDRIDDSVCDWRAEWFESLSFDPGNAYEFRKEVLRDEITRHSLLRAIYSRRQLHEVMVEFWTDHLNIDIEKGDCVYFKPWDDRHVIRKHALGRFRDLIRASATSPAMLVYLDGRDNKARPGTKDVPNENYARELLELHTLGVGGGYTQEDVREAARCLTGWTVDLRKNKFLADMNPFKPKRGDSYFRPDYHDDGTKRVLGQDFPSQAGAADLDRLIDIACDHPSTARHIAKKLIHRFLGEQVPPTLHDRVAATFTSTRGDIRAMLKEILTSAEFEASRGQMLKRPYRYIITALRACAADTHAHKPLTDYLHRLGQGLFQHPTPDGYPDEESPWHGTLLWRWNFSFALAGSKLPTVKTSPKEITKALGLKKDDPAVARTLFAHFTGRRPSPQEAAAIEPITDREEMLGVILASPAFQRC